MSDARYWRSLGELADTAEFRAALQREFPEDASLPPEGVTRRTMLQLLGASLSLAGLTACRRPAEKIVPYVNAPENIIPGVPLRYATTMPWGLNALGLLVTSHEGRPTKIEGNELHPATLGASSVWAQAAIYELYDPDRSAAVTYQGQTALWKRFVESWQKLHAEHAAAQGAGLAVVLEPFSSPTEMRLVEKLKRRFPQARVVAYAPLGDENQAEGVHLATGKELEPVFHTDRARVILSLDADFLLADRDGIRLARGFSASRRGKGEMNRLYVAESTLSVTGVAADHRVAMPSGRIAALLTALIVELAGQGLKLDLPADLKAPAAADLDAKWIAAVARDLRAHAGKSLILVGAHQPAMVHAAAIALNAALGNLGQTLTFSEPKEALRSHSENLKALAAAMKAGEIKTAIVLGGNPVYDAPADFDFAAALAKVPARIRLGMHADETSAACDWHIPQAHFLEAWGDARALGGPLSVVQPLIEPLFAGKSAIELLALLESGEDTPGHDLVRETWKALLGDVDFERRWERVLHDGVLAASELAPSTPAPVAGAVVDLARSPLAGVAPAKNGPLEIVFRPSAAVADGRFANVAWLQELPEPLTKLTWDNAALVSVLTARALGVSDGDVVKIRHQEREIEAPIMVLPGQAERSISLALGYGRTAAGRVGNGVGFDAYRLRSSTAWFGAAQVERTGRRHTLVATHEHWSTEGRDLVREETVGKDAHGAAHEGHDETEGAAAGSLWKEHEYKEGPQWGMTIDLSTCIGCNACAIACQSENNVPVVGKDEVRRGREMHWIRIDRYYSGSAEAPGSVVFQPVPCMQCENAPCEQVCPVAATVHDDQGLNVMIYNRCIGTRYCSNNCPYKVRRFNFYNFTKDTPELLKMAQNPDVTVRARGVMEKCSYCVQRLNAARIDAKLTGNETKDGDVQTACQQACPTRAIEFGDIRDPKSKVSQLKASSRNYMLLDEMLHTKPRTSYLVRLRNPNPEIHEA